MDDKTADEWLVGATQRSSLDEEARDNIMHRLARPVLPEEPTEAMLKVMYDAWIDNRVYVMREIYRALYRHLTKPQDRTMWQVVATGGPEALYLKKCPTACAAAEEARQWLEEGYNVRIEKVEVPND